MNARNVEPVNPCIGNSSLWLLPIFVLFQTLEKEDFYEKKCKTVIPSGIGIPHDCSNENPVLVGGKSYEKDQVVLTLKTDKTGIAARKSR